MISVCMATFNGAKYVKQQLRSILSQLGEADEVVVSDDGSTDGTLAAISGLGDPRIRVVEGPAQGSPTLNFENAMRHASGDYIFLSDQDDVWLDNKVSVMMDALRQFDCVVSDCFVTDDGLRVIAPSFRTLIGAREGRLYNLLVRNSYSGSCMAFRRCVMEKALPTPRGVLMHDIWLGNVAAFYFSLRILPDRLIYFRRHEGSASTAAHKSSNPIWRRLLSRLATVWALLTLR